MKAMGNRFPVRPKEPAFKNLENSYLVRFGYLQWLTLDLGSRYVVLLFLIIFRRSDSLNRSSTSPQLCWTPPDEQKADEEPLVAKNVDVVKGKTTILGVP